MANAQKSLLSLDEHNKYIYYQVVDLPGISADSLYKNAEYFIKSVYPKTKSIQSNNSINIKDKFLTYTSFVKHENGEMAYTLNIECKDAKYRYWLTDFVFTPYERNRYGVYVPINGIEIPLESAESKVIKKDLDGYFDQTGAFCKQLGEKLKKYMAEGHTTKKPDQQPVKKIVTDKW
ncbi:MAG: hypothetical protein JWQ66_604 [Mucilaginibacter sp.]|nr:hypothetical protein [Mucilaginibacter sp.]